MTAQNRSDPPGGTLDQRLHRLIDAVDGLGAGEEERREQLVERAEGRGLSRTTAEQAYDISREERLEPALGMAVVAEGLSVRLLDEAGADVATTESSEPEWLDDPPDPARAARERRLRTTFRRLRSLMDGDCDAREAVRAFARQPDLEQYDY